MKLFILALMGVILAVSAAPIEENDRIPIRKEDAKLPLIRSVREDAPDAKKDSKESLEGAESAYIGWPYGGGYYGYGYPLYRGYGYHYPYVLWG